MKIYTDKVRVMKNTVGLGNNQEINEMIGQELEVHTICSIDNTIRVYNKDKSNHFWFNESDVRFLTPAKFKGNSIAIGDYVERLDGNKGIVTGFYEYDGETRIVVERKKNGTMTFNEENITAHNTGLNETIEINGKKYNKEEVENKLSELKEIK